MVILNFGVAWIFNIRVMPRVSHISRDHSEVENIYISLELYGPRLLAEGTSGLIFQPKFLNGATEQAIRRHLTMLILQSYCEYYHSGGCETCYLLGPAANERMGDGQV